MEDIRAEREAREAQFRTAAADLDEDARNALHRMLFENPFYYGSIEQSGEDNADAVLEISGCESFWRNLTLCNVSGLPEKDSDFWELDHGGLSREGEDYVLTGEYLREGDDDLSPFSIRFSDASVEVRRYRAVPGWHARTPWDALEAVVYGLLAAHDGEAGLNGQEKALLPLAAELRRILVPYALPEQPDGVCFPQLRALMARYGYRKPLSLLGKLERLEKAKKSENSSAYWNRRRRIQTLLIAILNRKEYEPLWQDIYQAFAAAQAEYPTYAEGITPPEMLKKTRNEVEALLHARGYVGSYPDFHKTGAIRGLRCTGLTQYGKDYVIAAEKRVMYHIHCMEMCGSHLHLVFGCGTELLRKGEEPGDIYSCMFNDNGHRFYKTASEPRDWSGEYTPEKLRRLVDIAVKRAELRNLNKEEQELVSTAPQTGNEKLFRPLLLISLLFSAAWLVLFVPTFGLVFGLITSDVPAMFAELTKLPWLWVFLLVWLFVFICFYLVVRLQTSSARKK